MSDGSRRGRPGPADGLAAWIEVVPEPIAAEFARLQNERVAAYVEFAADVGSGARPAERHRVAGDGETVEAFRRWLDGQSGERRVE